MELVIHERADGVTHVALIGRLDATEMQAIEQPFAEATVGRNRPAIVELSGLEFMSSLGIGLLFANTKKLKQAGHKLVLLSPKGMVEEVLRSSKMDKVMPIARDLREAFQILGLVLEAAEPAHVSAAGAIDSGLVGQPVIDRAKAAAAGDALKVSIRNQMAELKGLYGSVADFLKAHAIPYRPSYAVHLALEELVVNIIRYAFFDDDAHLIDIDLRIGDEQLILIIEDDGRPFDPREGPEDPRDIDDPEVGGLGLVLVLDIVDALKYKRVDNRNRVEVRIHLGAVLEGDESDVALTGAPEAGKTAME
jgi:serine/threonine-protein kinase RsbW